MSIKPLKIGNVTVEKPIIQGGMGVGISLGNLAGAVAKEGGIGMISSAQIGYLEPDFDKDPLAANLRAIKKEYDKARKIAPDGVIGFNIMVALKHYEEYVQAAAEAGVDISALTWGNFLGANLLPVTTGNIVGGAVCVGCAYWFIYLKKTEK